jgi:hypothetical protein
MIDSITHHKFVANLEADKIDFDGLAYSVGFKDESRNFETGRTASSKGLRKKLYRGSGVDDVLDDEYMLAGYAICKI